MEIRSITLFCEPDYSLAAVENFFTATHDLFPVPVQTRRVALPPFPGWWPAAGGDQKDPVRFIERWQAAGADYVSLGPVKLTHDTGWIEGLPAILGAGGALFASAEVADTRGNIDPERASAIGALIRRASTLQTNGFGNLYFTALANCPPGSPFFPVAYHGGGAPSFALAIEGADLAVRAFHQRPAAEGRERLIAAIEAEATALVEVATTLAKGQRVSFGGLDFSLAPFPTVEKSLAGGIEALGLPWLGSHGSLFAAALVAEALGRARFPRCGFSGLMLPVLEDSILAARAAAGRITIQDLLSYAAVCGVGLDTLPLPGEVRTETLAAILLDVAALACRLNKPLTARLMPMPGRKAGDPVRFDFPYFSDSRVMAVSDNGKVSLLQQTGKIRLNSFQDQQTDEDVNDTETYIN